MQIGRSRKKVYEAKRKGSFLCSVSFLLSLSFFLSSSLQYPRCTAPDTTCACVSRLLFAHSLILLAAPRAYADAAPRTIEDFSMVNCFLREILPLYSAIECLFQDAGLSRVMRSLAHLKRPFHPQGLIFTFFYLFLYVLQIAESLLLSRSRRVIITGRR